MTGFDPTPFRAEAPILTERAYLDHAAMAPLPLRSQAAARDVLEGQAAGRATIYLDWMDAIEETRTRAARFLGAEPGEVVLVPNTAGGLSLVADALPWNPGDVALVSTPDFPSLVYPFEALRRHGVRCAPIPRGPAGQLTPDGVAQALRAEPRARLVAISSVDFATGYRADLEGIGVVCRERGVRYAIDAIQSLGAIPHDVNAIGCDVLCAGGHKWLLGPAGAGLLFVARRLWPVLSQPNGGWKSVMNNTDFSLRFDQLRPDASRLEAGTPNFAGFAALGASLELLAEADPQRIYPHLLDLTDRLAEGLRRRDYTVISPWGEGERSAILTAVGPDSSAADLEALAARLDGSSVSCSVRNGRLRLSPHLWNTAGDVERFFAALDSQ